MELTRKTFDVGVHSLTLTYKGFELNAEEAKCWYDIIKSCIPEEYFIDLIYFFCQRESAPTCPSELINFGLKVVVPDRF